MKGREKGKWGREGGNCFISYSCTFLHFYKFYSEFTKSDGIFIRIALNL